MESKLYINDTIVEEYGLPCPEEECARMDGYVGVPCEGINNVEKVADFLKRRVEYLNR